MVGLYEKVNENIPGTQITQYYYVAIAIVSSHAVAI